MPSVPEAHPKILAFVFVFESQAAFQLYTKESIAIEIHSEEICSVPVICEPIRGETKISQQG